MDTNKIKKMPENMSFEEALKELENAANFLKDPNTTLEDAINNFEKGVEYYNFCEKIINDAKQKIQTYNQEKGELE